MPARRDIAGHARRMDRIHAVALSLHVVRPQILV
jgi:hypothetical protein